MSDFRPIQRRSPNFNQRPKDSVIDMLVLHYTGMNSANSALKELCNPNKKVSAHYLVDEDGKCFQLVDEANRAWHAGESRWAGNSDVNGYSIGIELVNPGHEFGYRPFPEEQMHSLETLVRYLLNRHSIPAQKILGHSDVAPSRKRDPGELFNWHRLATNGIGLWPNQKYDHIPMAGNLLKFGMSGTAVTEIQKQLSYFGYNIQITGHYDLQMKEVVTAFQRHFRPQEINGVFDTLCSDLLLDLLDQIE